MYNIDIPHDHGPHVHYNHQVFPFKYKVILCHGILMLLVILALLKKFPELLADSNGQKEHILTGTVCFVFCFLVFLCLKLFFHCLDRQKPSGELEKKRRDLMVGYGAIAFYGLVSEVVVLVLGDGMLTWTIVTICYLCPMFLIPLFILRHFRRYTIATPWNNVFYLKLSVFLAHAIFCVVTVNFVAEFATEQNSTVINSLTFVHTLVYAPCSMEFAVIWSNGIRYDDGRRRNTLGGRRKPLVYECRVCGPVCEPIQVQDVELQVLQAHLTTGEESEDGNPKTASCGICTLKFNDTSIIPRLLVECGHTVCEECIKRIMYFDVQTRKVRCPFCMVVTDVPNGKPRKLPKNDGISGTGPQP